MDDADISHGTISGSAGSWREVDTLQAVRLFSCLIPRHDLPKLQSDLRAWQRILSSVRRTTNDLCNTVDLDQRCLPVCADLANLVQVSFAHLNRLSLEFHSLPA